MDIIQQEQNLKCQKHQKKDIEFFQINELDKENLFYCSSCINEDLSFKGINYLMIQQIIDQGSTHIIQKWPPVNDYEIIKKLIEITSIDTHKSAINQITSYFSYLKEEILTKLDICQKNMVNNALQLPLEREQIIKQYQDISSISQLKQLLSNVNQATLLNQQQECLKFVQQFESQKDKNTELLQNLLTKCQSIKDLINFEYPNAIKQTILSYIDDINFFDEKIIIQSNKSQQGNNHKEKIDIVMNLISNKSNYCSDEFLSSIKQSIKKLNPILEQLSFDNIFKEDKKPIDFSQLNIGQLDQINEYVNHLTLLKNINNDYESQIKQSIKIKEMNNIITNKFNFINLNFTQQFEQFQIDQYPFLNKMDFDQVFNERIKFDFFRDLNVDIIDDLFLLTQKRKELEYNNNYNQSQTFNEQNENLMIKDQYKEEEIDRIFKKYPIFDLLEIQQNIPNVQLVATDYKNGKDNTIITRIGNYYQVCTKNDNWSESILDLILENDKKYIFRFKIDNTIDNSQKLFYLGLANNKNNSTRLKDNLCCYFDLDDNLLTIGLGINQVIKGNGFNQGDDIIEMRVCLKDQIVEILDYPNYNYKVGLNDKQKQNLHNEKDLKVCIGLIKKNIKIILIDCLKVKQYVD